MKFELTIKCENAAFEHNIRREVARIMEELANLILCNGPMYLSDHCSTYVLRDENGNRLGRAEFSAD